MFENVNRAVLIIFPKQPLIDWANSHNPDHKEDCSKPLEHDQGNVYLIPEFDYPADALAYVKQNVRYIFEYELMEWQSDEAKWPEKRTWEIFEQWFHYSIQSVLVDVMKNNIKKYK